MAVLLLIICLVMFILGIILALCDKEHTAATFCWTAIVLFALVVIFFIPVTISYVNSRTCDEKIVMYEEENKKIEKKIEATVKQYMDFEKDTYSKLKTDSYINLVSLYPELKSDKLIQEQIETYQENSDTIISLKEKKINRKTLKWWLFW
jgi:predicted Co/Zn/Cd cation transporter (cation efflux family)